VLPVAESFAATKSMAVLLTVAVDVCAPAAAAVAFTVTVIMTLRSQLRAQSIRPMNVHIAWYYGHMIPRLISLAIRDSPKSVLLLGPRQVGKSTLMLDLRPDLTVNLNDDKTYLDFKSNPNELRERLAAHSGVRSVLIDEIQRHPTILNTLQTIIDDKSIKSPKFYITGSSARKLKRGQANLLPGRIFGYELGPLCAAELDYKLDVNMAMSYGTLPEPYLSRSESFREKLLTTYSGVYLREEIQAEALTRNLDGFSRFIISAAEHSGLVLDFSKLAKQAKIERKACARFYEVLEDTLIASRLEVFDKTHADIKKRPKFYFFDTGVLNGLLGNFVASADRRGMLFEHLVIGQALASAKARDTLVKVSYFRTRSGYEVDLILELRGKTYAVEIKAGHADQGDAGKLESFREYYKNVDGYFLVTADETPARKIGRVLIVNLSQFLREVGL
jgi:predicted AAA+ superfamily ATPase